MTPQEQLAKEICRTVLEDYCRSPIESENAEFVKLFEHWKAMSEGSALIAKIGQQIVTTSHPKALTDRAEKEFPMPLYNPSGWDKDQYDFAYQTMCDHVAELRAAYLKGLSESGAGKLAEALEEILKEPHYSILSVVAIRKIALEAILAFKHPFANPGNDQSESPESSPTQTDKHIHK